jgi:hypothetical protein
MSPQAILRPTELLPFKKQPLLLSGQLDLLVPLSAPDLDNFLSRSTNFVF